LKESKPEELESTVTVTRLPHHDDEADKHKTQTGQELKGRN
jgi:hypothetical protein